MNNHQSTIINPKIVVIGASLGGLNAFEALLKGLPPDFPLPIVGVQHREKDSDDTLGTLLQRYTDLKIGEAEDKESILPGQVYLAPPDYHLLIEDEHFALSTEAPVNYSRPSIDVLFESAADVYGERVIGIILTGANDDGAKGLAAIKRRGGLTIVQDPSTAEAAAMPEAAIAAANVDKILPLEEIGPFLTEVSKKLQVSRCKLQVASDKT